MFRVRVLASDSYKFSKKPLKYRNILHSNQSMEIQAPLNLSSGNHPILYLFPLQPLHVLLYLCFGLICNYI